jgi:hypothetical protein
MNLTPPDPVCKFCDDTCSGTCEGAREQRETERHAKRKCDCGRDRVRWNTVSGHSPQCNLSRATAK